MATEVGICNLALSHLGDDATVASIDPPEGSPQATHCATFYPIARDAMQEKHNWGFCTTRAALSLLAALPVTGWFYAYAQPSNAINFLGVFNPTAQDDFDPQPFETEVLPDGTEVIYTNVEQAVCRYTIRVTDPSRFSPLFVEAFGWLLAAYLAGPILKGDAGATATVRCLKMFEVEFAQAKASDANQRRVKPTHNVPWVTGR